MARELTGACSTVAEIPEIGRYCTTGSVRIEVECTACELITKSSCAVSALLRIYGVAIGVPAVVGRVDDSEAGIVGTGAIVLMYT